MTSASKKYQVTLAIITAAFVALLAVGHIILTPVAEGPMFWAFIYIPFLGTAALTLTIPFSLVWMAIAAVKKKWDSVRNLAVAVLLPVVGLAASVALNCRILREIWTA
jgi:hypothetical protein